MGPRVRSGVWLAVVMLAWPVPANAVPPPRLPPTDARSEAGVSFEALELERTFAGGYRHVDRANGFEATIESDGRVTFRDITRFTATTTYQPDEDGDDPWRFLRGPYAPKQSVIEETGNPRILYGPYGPPPIIFGVGGTFGGIGDAKGAGDTGRKAAKRRFLASTQDMRARLAAGAERRRAAQALAVLRVELMEIWTEEGRTYAQRRATLFQRWDESQEPVEPGDAHVTLGAAGTAMRSHPTLIAGAEARRRVEAFIRHVAPAGSRHAFTHGELQRFNAQRRSRARFDPYFTDLPPTPEIMR